MSLATLQDNNLPRSDSVSYPNSYVAVPPNGKTCAITGLKHAHLYRLLLRGPAAKHIRIVNLREPGASRGRLLFHAGDALRWLDSLAAAQAPSRHQQAGGAGQPAGSTMSGGEKK